MKTFQSELEVSLCGWKEGGERFGTRRRDGDVCLCRDCTAASGRAILYLPCIAETGRNCAASGLVLIYS